MTSHFLRADYLGIGISYLMAPVYLLFGETFFSALAAAEITTLAMGIMLIVSLALIFDLRLRSLTLLALVVLLWGLVFCELLYGHPGAEFIEAGNSLLLLRQGLPWLIFLLLAIRATVIQRRGAGPDRSASKQSLTFPCYLAASLAGFAPFWSNASGFAACIALVMTLGLAILLTPGSRAHRLRLLGACAAVTLVSVVFALLIVSGGKPIFYLDEKFNGVADYQFWYFAPFGGDHRVFRFVDLLIASVWRFGWAGLLGQAGAAFALVLVWRRHGLADLRTLGLIFIVLAHLGTGMIVQLVGHMSPRYLLVLYSVGFIAGLIALAQTLAPWLYRRSGWSADSWNLLGRIAAMLGVVILAGLVYQRIEGELQDSSRVFYPPLGLYVDAEQAEEYDALAKLRDDPRIAGLAPSDRIFSTYLSPAEIMLDAEPATRFGSSIHVLGDAARAEYAKRFTERVYPLVAILSQTRTIHNWHPWQLRANWYLYAQILKDYEAAFRTRYMMFLRPRRAPVQGLAELPNVSCALKKIYGARTELVVRDDSTDDDAVFGDDWIYNATLDLEATLEPRSFPMNLLPFVGTRGMIVVNDQSSSFMEGVVKKFPAPIWRYEHEPGMRFGLPLGKEEVRLPVEHRFGSTSYISFETFPRKRTDLTIQSCVLSPVAPSPFVDFDEHFPPVSQLDPLVGPAGE